VLGVRVACVDAEGAWWLWFQADYIGGVTAAAAAGRHARAVLADRIAAIEPTAVEQLLEAHPHLRYEGGRFAVDQNLLAAFVAEQRSALRMFRYEGVFFVFVVLTGLYVLARSLDRKSTRLNSSHVKISYAVFCLKKKKK